ncbi:MAG: lipase family alpha/beta hydrolase [Bdellovibrionota bacterium]
MLPLGALAGQSLQGRPALRHPIVLVHGATIHGSHLNVGPFDLGDYFAGIPAFLSASGTDVKVVELTTDGTIEERASVLKNFLETDMKGQMVNIIGHSLGGLDARFCASVLHATQIASITTIGTPHLGTPLADWAVSQIENNGLWYWFFRMVGYDMNSRRFLREITTEGMKYFNEKVPDSLDVRYYSFRTRARFSEGTMSPILWFPTQWLEGRKHYLNADGHDGLVPYDSQLWGKEIGSSTELDHLAQMNHHELRFTGQEQESLRMYVSIYDNLQHEGL